MNMGDSKAIGGEFDDMGGFQDPARHSRPVPAARLDVRLACAHESKHHPNSAFRSPIARRPTAGSHLVYL